MCYLIPTVQFCCFSLFLGGYIIIVMRAEYLSYVKEYKDKLEPRMEELVTLGKWTQESRTIVQKYSFDNDGIIYKFKIC